MNGAKCFVKLEHRMRLGEEKEVSQESSQYYSRPNDSGILLLNCIPQTEGQIQGFFSCPTRGIKKLEL